ncbi:MAG: MarR family transcriptional regulator [Ruminococcaceae bacterium]|nr:MarR family transcriptional regulator [Oscillospiraceae bacterium]
MIFIMKKINTISRCAVLYRNDKLNDKTLTPLYHSYVFIITKNPGITQDELASELCINKSNVTRGLNNLEEMGFVKRMVDENDKRVLRVYPTEKMIDAFPKIRKVLKDWNRYLTDDINEEEIEIFQSVLERITNRAKDYINGREEV